MAESDLRKIDDILTRLPSVIPRGVIDVKDDEYLYRSEKQKYFVRKAPIREFHEITATVGGTKENLTQGTDYQIIDNDGDGEDDTIDFSIGGDSPDDDTYFHADYRSEAVIARYVDAHDVDVEGIENNIDDVIKSAQVNRATGGNLNRVGAIFGELGKRAGRNNDEYRALLKSIVQSFKGRGTKPGMEFAIAAGIGIDQDQVQVIEDTANTGYTIEIDSSVDSNIVGSVINDMAELADPSGVKLLSPPIIFLDGDTIIVDRTETSITASSTGLGGGTLNMDGTSTLG